MVKSVYGDCLVSIKSIKLKVKIIDVETLVDFRIIKNVPCPCVLGKSYLKMVPGFLDFGHDKFYLKNGARLSDGLQS